MCTVVRVLSSFILPSLAFLFKLPPGCPEPVALGLTFNTHSSCSTTNPPPIGGPPPFWKCQNTPLPIIILQTRTSSTST